MTRQNMSDFEPHCGFKLGRGLTDAVEDITPKLQLGVGVSVESRNNCHDNCSHRYREKEAHPEDP